LLRRRIHNGNRGGSRELDQLSDAAAPPRLGSWGGGILLSIVRSRLLLRLHGWPRARRAVHGFVYLRELGVFATFAPNDASSPTTILYGINTQFR
jgi:hypothetical protein